MYTILQSGPWAWRGCAGASGRAQGLWSIRPRDWSSSTSGHGGAAACMLTKMPVWPPAGSWQMRSPLVVGPEHSIPRGPQGARAHIHLPWRGWPKAQRPVRFLWQRPLLEELRSVTPIFPSSSGREQAFSWGSRIVLHPQPQPQTGGKSGVGLSGAWGGKNNHQALGSHHPKTGKLDRAQRLSPSFQGKRTKGVGREGGIGDWGSCIEGAATGALCTHSRVRPAVGPGQRRAPSGAQLQGSGQRASRSARGSNACSSSSSSFSSCSAENRCFMAGELGFCGLPVSWTASECGPHPSPRPLACLSTHPSLPARPCPPPLTTRPAESALPWPATVPRWPHHLLPATFLCLAPYHLQIALAIGDRFNGKCFGLEVGSSELSELWYFPEPLLFHLWKGPMDTRYTHIRRRKRA